MHRDLQSRASGDDVLSGRDVMTFREIVKLILLLGGLILVLFVSLSRIWGDFP